MCPYDSNLPESWILAIPKNGESLISRVLEVLFGKGVEWMKR